jgi:hypothetical protein
MGGTIKHRSKKQREVMVIGCKTLFLLGVFIEFKQILACIDAAFTSPVALLEDVQEARAWMA